MGRKRAAKWPRGYGHLADQIRRAMTSVVLNQAEGNARKSQAERRRFFEVARASVAEVGRLAHTLADTSSSDGPPFGGPKSLKVAACVDLMFAFGLIGRVDYDGYKSRLTAISKILWALMK